MSNLRITVLSTILSVAGAGACKSGESGTSATAELKPLGASGVDGDVTFTPSGGGVRVEARIRGLSPGDHGIHIHEFGVCSQPDGKAAGEHFNPDHIEHGAPDASRHHAGDLGNVVGAGADKLTTIDVKFQGFTLDAGPRGILGRSLVVHAEPDDYTAQPAGNSGARIACGVIRATRGETQVVEPAK
ncbi:superoxide dismutase family protein [Nannocystis punicea]|uniref:Superoxide dismutase [Cu-Zn] n=1 Tax=Nannocystis punicea TaxID=2995304 RepID=A0ABY7GSA3_9BACT|nr:superoxide dismutase family protein [Nannocystis poenicansa]WAS89798.1 superoxide dismutase family protein [Nannocystis poenicansa]